MSRTYKDRPFFLIREDARSRGFSHVRVFGWGFSREEIDLRGYAYTRKRNPHIPVRRWCDWRWIEDDWHTDYGSDTRIRDMLHVAVDEYNSGRLDEDWDEPNVYQRRRRWYC